LLLFLALIMLQQTAYSQCAGQEEGKVFKDGTGLNPLYTKLLAKTADLYHDTKERGNVHHVAVDTGDLDQDGKDEIVLGRNVPATAT